MAHSYHDDGVSGIRGETHRPAVVRYDDRVRVAKLLMNVQKMQLLTSEGKIRELIDFHMCPRTYVYPY